MWNKFWHISCNIAPEWQWFNFSRIKLVSAKKQCYEKISETLEEYVLYAINVYLGKYKYNIKLKTNDVSTVKQADEKPGFDITNNTIESPIKNNGCKFVTISA